MSKLKNIDQALASIGWSMFFSICETSWSALALTRGSYVARAVDYISNIHADKKIGSQTFDAKSTVPRFATLTVVVNISCMVNRAVLGFR